MPVCLENAIYLFSIFRIVVHLTRVINRNGVPIEYFSNRPSPIPLSRLFDYINCSSVSAKFNFQPTCSRNLPCLEIINLSSLTFSLFFLEREKEGRRKKKRSRCGESLARFEILSRIRDPGVENLAAVPRCRLYSPLCSVHCFSNKRRFSVARTCAGSSEWNEHLRFYE